MTAVSATSPPPGAAHTVTEVARLTGTTVRTIRWYQSEGLLPAPRRVGRVAVYDDEHVARLESIRELQSHGLTLTAIRRLLDRVPNGAAMTALAFVTAAVAHSGEEPEILGAGEGMARLKLADDDEVDAALLEELEVIRVLDDGRWQIVAPAAFNAAAEMAAYGIPIHRSVAIARVMHRHTRAISRAVVEMFVQHMVRPNVPPAGNDPEAWSTLEQAVERLRPLATASVAEFFDAALARESELATERELEPRRR
ncbi:MAG TPA: MerR family transcriptional regulator [Acidimicrobiales bacterium]|nr:MerR family transcriptional regulator [Acidimicrobiales bacterium]